MRDDTILLALRDGTLVGYIQLSEVRIPVAGASAADQELFALYVDAALHGQGIGSALMDPALSHPRLKGARNIYLDVWQENRRAVDLYLRHGFRVVGTRDVVIAARTVGNDLVMMRPARI